jgi:hypothetical protein
MSEKKKTPTTKQPQTAEALIDAAHMVRERALQTKLARHAAEKKALLTELDAAEKRFDALAEIDASRRPLRPMAPARKGRGRDTVRPGFACAIASDWHVEEVVNPVTIDGLNEYNPVIAEYRAQKFFEGAWWLIREQRKIVDCRELLLECIGDMITGFIHEELMVTNAMTPPEATLHFQKIWSDGVRWLLANTDLESILIVFLPGNHGRTSKKVHANNTVKMSYEWMAYHSLAKEFRNEKRVQCIVPGGRHHVQDVRGFRVHSHHGDTVKSNGGIGGLDVPMNRAITQWHQSMPADVTLTGHFHEYNPGIRGIRNGSLIGYNAFARDVCRARFSKACQAFFVVDDKEGISQQTRIWCQ